MSQKYISYIIFLALCCLTSTRACAKRPLKPHSVDLQTAPPTTTPVPLTCPTTFYTGPTCEAVLAATRQLASLRQALATELRVQSHRMRGNCSISRSTWDIKSLKFLTIINHAENHPGKKACYYSVAKKKDKFICAAYVQLLECAATRLQSAYESNTSGLQDWQHESWAEVWKFALYITEDLGTILSDREPKWESIKLNMQKLEQLLRSIRTDATHKITVKEINFNPKDADIVFTTMSDELDYGD